MTEQEMIAARLANTENALLAIITVLQELQPPYAQDIIDRIMCDYFNANTSLGFEPNKNFITIENGDDD